jgi:hypothetical protein
MADAVTTSGAELPENETPNQKQARLRREKLRKKMADQGEDRLAKIKALNGGVAPPDEVLGGRECFNYSVSSSSRNWRLLTIFAYSCCQGRIGDR